MLCTTKAHYAKCKIHTISVTNDLTYSNYLFAVFCRTMFRLQCFTLPRIYVCIQIYSGYELWKSLGWT